MISNGYHTPVLLEESVEGLSVRPDGTYVDLTYGGGGHSREILKQLTSGTLIAFDQDPAVKPHLISDRRFVFVQHNYRYLKNYLDYMGISAV
ncbi:MAG: 16S rRNA (cytosine(1402)-N(4))-methyltransferase, partial [Candidatus Cloacimonetes bacterium]|nr:16S rRNA (cytosine(1402)-N(4))-methyltransferase [Candidatus Cloacimonadota bacterium]